MFSCLDDPGWCALEINRCLCTVSVLVTCEQSRSSFSEGIANEQRVVVHWLHSWSLQGGGICMFAFATEFLPCKGLFGARVLYGISGDNPLRDWVKTLPSPNPHKYSTTQSPIPSFQSHHLVDRDWGINSYPWQAPINTNDGNRSHPNKKFKPRVHSV